MSVPTASAGRSPNSSRVRARIGPSRRTRIGGDGSSRLTGVSAGCSIASILRSQSLLEIPLLWDLNDSAAARSRTRIPRRDIYYHDRPFLSRREISLEREFAAPRIKMPTRAQTRGGKILGTVIDTSSVR